MNTLAAGPNRWNGWWPRMALSVLPIAAVSVLGSWATLPNIPAWYASLTKPPLTPPNWVFGPTWTLLYCLMAFAIWRVLSASPRIPGRERAIVLFFVQLGLNGLWSWSFFAAHNPTAGLVNILALDAVAIATITVFARVDRLAAWCLAPYLAWILFATYLNAGILVLNG